MEIGNYQYVNEEGFFYHNRIKNDKYMEISLEQFKKHVLKQTFMETNREINYYEVLQTVWGLNGVKFSTGDKLYAENKESLPYFEKFGILKDTTIFKPVYKEEEFKVGDIVKVNNPCSSSKNKRGDIGKISTITKGKLSDFSQNTIDIYNVNGWFEAKSALTLASKEEIKTYENNLLLEKIKNLLDIYERSTILVQK